MTNKKFESAFAIYTTQEVIGEGGSGVVYKASDENNNIVAIKCLDLKKATKEKQKRFKNEINFCVRNTHKRIITVMDYGGTTTIRGVQINRVQPDAVYL